MHYIESLASTCSAVLAAEVRLPADEEKTEANLALMSHFSAALPPHNHAAAMQLAQFLLRHVDDRDGSIQKKMYRTLLTVVDKTGTNKIEKEKEEEAFVSTIMARLIETQSTVAHPAKATRLLLLASLIPRLTSATFHTVQSVIPECMLGVKEVAAEARETSFGILRAIAAQILTLEDAYFTVEAAEDETDRSLTRKPATLTEFLYLLMAGLAGKTPHMQAASVRSLNTIMHAFARDITPEMQATLLETMLVLLESKNREVVKATLGAVKTIVTRFAMPLVEQHLRSIVQATIKWRKEHKQFFQLDVKYTFEKLLHRFGYSFFFLL